MRLFRKSQFRHGVPVTHLQTARSQLHAAEITMFHPADVTGALQCAEIDADPVRMPGAQFAEVTVQMKIPTDHFRIARSRQNLADLSCSITAAEIADRLQNASHRFEFRSG